MNKKYSKIREKLKIVVDKNTTDEMVRLTHYFQNHKKIPFCLITNTP